MDKSNQGNSVNSGKFELSVFKNNEKLLHFDEMKLITASDLIASMRFFNQTGHSRDLTIMAPAKGFKKGKHVVGEGGYKITYTSKETGILPQETQGEIDIFVAQTSPTKTLEGKVTVGFNHASDTFKVTANFRVED